MRMTNAIRDFIADMRQEGRLTSWESIRAYEDVLALHAQDVGNRDPRTTGREDIKATLARWPHPNTQAQRRTILMSFYRWTVQEGIRPYNPVEQTRPPKRRQAVVYRLTEAEAHALLLAAEPGPEQRLIALGLHAGLRLEEMRLMQGRHFARAGFVWVSQDIGKGQKERWVPVLPELRAVVEEIRANVTSGEFVLPASKTGIAGGRTPYRMRRLDPTRPIGRTTIYTTVVRLGERAGIKHPVHPHLLRHAFCDHVALRFGLEIAQALMGHSNPATTQGYRSTLTPEDLARAIATPLADGLLSERYPQGESNPRDTPPAADVLAADSRWMPLGRLLVDLREAFA